MESGDRALLASCSRGINSNPALVLYEGLPPAVSRHLINQAEESKVTGYDGTPLFPGVLLEIKTGVPKPSLG